MITLDQLYEDFKENEKTEKAICESMEKYFFSKTPTDIVKMMAEDAAALAAAKNSMDVKKKIVQHFPNERAFLQAEQFRACPYDFRFDTRFAVANGTLVLPKPFAGDTCSIALVSKKDSMWTDCNAALTTEKNGKFVRGWMFQASLNQILTIWLFGTPRGKNMSMDPGFLMRTFGGKFDAGKRDGTGPDLLAEELYSHHKTIDLVTNDLRYKHLHKDHSDRIEKIGDLVRKQNGFIGNPVIVADFGQRRDQDPHPVVITDQNYILVYEKNKTISDENMFDLYKLSASALIKKFYTLRNNIVEKNNRPFGKEISKAMVKRAVEDEQAGLVI